MDTVTTIRTTLYQLLAEIDPLRAPPDDRANDDRPITDFIDSFSLVTLIMEVERTFDLQVGDDETNADNFGSVALLAQFVTRKRGVTA